MTATTGPAPSIPNAIEACNGIDDDCDGQIDEEACSCEVGVDGASAWLACTTPLAWHDAAAACASTGHHLASLDGIVAQASAVDLATAAATGDAWIGLNDGDSENAWAWEDGTPFAHADWAGGEPDDGEENDDHEGQGGEDCVLQDGDNGRWRDWLCSDPLPYLCERECDVQSWFADGDGDGLGSRGFVLYACTRPDGTAANDEDCDDTDPTRPAVRYADVDGDGFPGTPTVACEGAVVRWDCDDTDPTVSPGGEDCDDLADTGASSGGPTTPVATAGADEPGTDEGGTNGTGAGAFDTNGTAASGSPPLPPPDPATGFGCGCVSGVALDRALWPWALLVVSIKRRRVVWLGASKP